MPASLFATWAGTKPRVEYRVTPATTVTWSENPCDAAGLADLVEVAGAAPLSVTRATTSPCDALAVTAVAQPVQQRLPGKRKQKQCGIRRNPSNLEIRAVSARLDAGEPSAWRMLFERRVAHRLEAADRTRADAESLAFGDCLVEWHRRCAQQPDTDRCAGCSEVLPNGVGLVVDRGALRVHFDVVRGFDCLIAYGRRWRSAAVAGLHDLGLGPPTGFEVM
jgi:hypothetical protein